MKKIFNIMLILSLVLPNLLFPVSVDAKTLRQMQNDLNALEAEYKSSNQTKALTEQQIKTTHQNIAKSNTDIAKAGEAILKLEKDIKTLEIEIKNRDVEIKELMNFIQVANGELAYLEYAFGAKSFTDFIYRIAVSEQLATYNQDLMKNYNQMIVQNNKSISDLDKKTRELEQKQVDLERQIKSLGSKLSDLNEITISIEEEIKLQRSSIQLYKDLGCGLDEDIALCGRNKLPPGTAFFRPVVAGKVTSEFGMRFHPTLKVWRLHAGVDIGTTYSTNVPIYAAAEGMVIALSIKSSCGGNIVYIHHNINGKTYTTMYAHLRSINVTPKQVVDRNTVIGIMGGDAETRAWDDCTTGLHLHFQIATGLYLKDYTAYSTFTARSFDPRQVINLPAGSGWFSDRLTKY
jgi:murein DD-endopeptidase MepM/ murein hydrolase activator NlpD